MIRIAISVEAFEAIARTLPLGSVGYEAEPNERGERTVSLEGGLGQPARRDARPGRDVFRCHSQAGCDGGANMTRLGCAIMATPYPKNRYPRKA
jgi:hypothetical protein